jgi:enamine deaminase RidA (YjgF/YER057c/UK114 family)
MLSLTTRQNQCIDNLEAVLKAHGSGLEHIVKTNIFVTGYEHFNEMNEAYTARMPKPAPARSCIGAAVLPRGVDIEIECIATLPKARL